MVEVVADDDLRQAASGERGDQLGDALRLLEPERRHRLIHDQDPRPPVDRPSDGDRLPLAAGETPDLLADRRDHHVQLVEDADRFLLHAAFVEEPHRAAPAGHLAPDEEVLHDVAMVGQGQVLVDRLDADRPRRGRGGEADRPAVHLEVPLVRLDDAREDLDERRLAGPVVAHDAGDRAGRELEGDVLDGMDSAVSFGDAPRGEEGRSRPGLRCRCPAHCAVVHCIPRWPFVRRAYRPVPSQSNVPAQMCAPAAERVYHRRTR